jgi:hypothetical protein
MHARRGAGHLDRLARMLRRLPHVHTVRANHTARTVTVTFDPQYLTGPRLIERLCHLGLAVAELAEPAGWGALVAERVAPRVTNPATLSGRAHLKLLAATGGRVHLVRAVAGLLVLVAALDGRAALLRGAGIPWTRVLTYLSVAAALWTRSPEAEREGAR